MKEIRDEQEEADICDIPVSIDNPCHRNTSSGTADKTTFYPYRW